MRKKEYDAEKNDKVAIGLIIFNIVIVMVFIMCFPKQYRMYGFDRQLALETFFVAMLFLGVGGYALWLYKRSNKITKYINEMRRTGECYTGWIVRVEEYAVYFRGKDYKYTYAVVVDCNIDGKDYQLLSKPLCFNPMEKFASRKCSVYVRDNTYVITDFDYKNSYSTTKLNVPFVSLEVDEQITAKHADDFSAFKLKR